MADTLKPPKRRRRTIVIAVVLLVVSTVAWWYWPRGDSRFVGKWLLVESKPMPNVISTTWTFRANGEFWISGRYTNRAAPIDFYSSWRIRGNRLVTGFDGEQRLGWILGPLQDFLTARGGPSIVFFWEESELVSVTPDEIVLRDTESEDLLTLRRVHE